MSYVMSEDDCEIYRERLNKLFDGVELGRGLIRPTPSQIEKIVDMFCIGWLVTESAFDRGDEG